MRVTCQTPSGRLSVNAPDCIGRFYVVVSTADSRRYVCNCIDATPEGRPKRMRVQFCGKQGDVLQPGQYEIIERDPMWED